MNYSQVFEVMKANSAYRVSTSYPLVGGTDKDQILRQEYYKFIPTNAARLIETPSTGMNKSLIKYIYFAIVFSLFGILIIYEKTNKSK